jgi:hypothetical protein
MRLFYERMRAGWEFRFVDPKGSYTFISRRKAKKRLRARRIATIGGQQARG